MRRIIILFSFALIFSFSTFINAQETKLPPNVTETIGELVEAREKVESLGRLVVKYHKTATDTELKQKYIRTSQLYGETRAAFKSWSEMVRDVLIQKGKKGAEKELRTNPSFAEKNRKAVDLANQFIKQAEDLLYEKEEVNLKGLFPFPTFDQLKQLGIDIIKGIFKWKEYKDKQRRAYAQEFYCRVEWDSTWEVIEGGTPAKSECAERPKVLSVEYKITQIHQNPPVPLNFQTNQVVEQYIAYYQGREKRTMEVGLYRYGVHERMIRRIFNEEGVTEDLAHINQVEKMSGLSGKTLWIFDSKIASKYGLRKTKFIDETRSFEKATRAMAQYLKFLYEKYDKNWELAASAYESGESNVDLAIKRAKVKDFWTVYRYLPRETRNFVPNLLATILIAKNRSTYGFEHIRFAPQLNYETLRIAPSISLLKIAQLADTSVDYLRYLNPEFLSNVTPPSIYYIRVPMGKGEIIAETLRKSVSR